MIETRHGPTPSPVKITMEEVLTDLAKETGLTIRVLLGKGRGRVESQAAYVGREAGGISLTEAAKYLRRDLSTSTLSSASKRLEEELSRDSGGRCRWSGSAPGFAKDADVIIK